MANIDHDTNVVTFSNKYGICTDVAPEMGTAQEGADLFQGPNPPYGRGGGTPAARYLNQQILQHVLKTNVTEGAFAPIIVTCPNGQSANQLAFRGLYGGDLLASNDIFGTTNAAIAAYSRFGGNVARVSATDTAGWLDRMNGSKPPTALFAELPSNPLARVPDLDALSDDAKENGITRIFDITLALGFSKLDILKYADVVTMSLSKQGGGGQNLYMGGAVATVRDAVTQEQAHRLSELPHYFNNANGELVIPENPLGALINKIGMTEGGNSIVPVVAIDIGDSMEELEARVAQMCENARMVAEILEAHPKKVERVQLAGYKTDPENDERFREYLGPNAFMLSFDVLGEFKNAGDYINAGEHSHSVQLGQKQTAVSVPAQSTQRQKPKDQREAMGVNDNTVRFSTGCEDPNVLERQVVSALQLIR